MPNKTKGGAQQSRKNSQSSGHGGIDYLRQVLGLISHIIDRFGWPGAVIVFGYLFVEKNGTVQQKQEIIDKFILGKGIDDLYPLIILGVLSMLVMLAQRHYYQQREKILQKEIDRLAEWKSAYQEAHIPADLHHTGAVTKEKG